MDSKQLFIKSEFLTRKINWLSDWQYIGLEAGSAVRFETVLRSFTTENEVILVFGRHDTELISLAPLTLQLSTGLQERNFKLWTVGFTSILEYSAIGVYRLGQVC